MKTKKLIIAAFLIGFFTMNSIAQSFSLNTFQEGFESVKKELKLSGVKAETFDKTIAQLDKDLLKLNSEINGKTESQVKSLISKKFQRANDNLKKVLSAEEMTVVQNLNNSNMTTLTNGLIGTHGAIRMHKLEKKNGIIDTKGARGQISIVVGTAIK